MAITGKERSRRIDRYYTDSVDASIVWKRRLGWVGLVMGLAYGLWLLSPSAAKQFSTGELSKAHHAWNQAGCENCHDRLSPIRTTSFGNVAAIADNNKRCNQCHQIPDHYPESMKPSAMASESCVQCHHEHLGINHNLLDIADENCVRCHKDLSSFAVNAEESLSKIASFDPVSTAAHGSFRGLAQDTGTIHFSHIQHMRPGQPAEVGARSAKKFSSLTARYQEQYKSRIDANGLIQLQCGDCHVRSSHQDIFQPVDYAKHCKACHQLDVPHKLDMQDMQSLKEEIFASQNRTLRRLLDNAPLDQSSTKSEQYSLTDPVFNEKSRQSESGHDLISLIDEASPLIRFEIFQTFGCGKCHQVDTDPTDGPTSKHIVKPSGIKSQWLTGASFTHDAHVNIECKQCHLMDLESSVKTSDSVQPQGGLSSQVLIGDIDNCRTCHIVDEAKRFEVRNAGNPHVATGDCIDCHRYHHDPKKLNPGYTSKLISDVLVNSRIEASEVSVP
jgi:hypothetical protein